MTAKTPAQRVADSDARKRAAGLKQIRALWAHPEDFAAIREYAAKLQRKRVPRDKHAAIKDAARKVQTQEKR